MPCTMKTVVKKSLLNNESISLQVFISKFKMKKKNVIAPFFKHSELCYLQTVLLEMSEKQNNLKLLISKDPQEFLFFQ